MDFLPAYSNGRTSLLVDKQKGDEIDVEEYGKLRSELLTILNAEEADQYTLSLSRDTRKDITRFSEIMEEAWASGTFWYSLPLSSPTSLFSLFHEHIQPLLSKNDAEKIGETMPVYW